MRGPPCVHLRSVATKLSCSMDALFRATAMAAV
jgi:hypothetical protein